MKNITLIALLLSILQMMFAQQAYHPVGMKQRFDIDQAMKTNHVKSATLKEFKLALQNDVWQYTLMDGGFFTVGLNKGLSKSTLEANSQITYGHPFSMTSFPYSIIDGVKIGPEALLANNNDALRISKDTLMYEVEVKSNVFATLIMHLGTDNQINIEYIIENKDASNHEVGAGLLLDAALGKWGDGALYVDDALVDSAVDLLNVKDSIVIFERGNHPRGIGISIKTQKTSPDHLKCGNWMDLYKGASAFEALYDLALLYSWDAKTLAPSEKIEYAIVINELALDYDGQEFIRWNLPNALSIENNMLFPMEISTNIEVVSDKPLQDYKYHIVGHPYVKEYESINAFPEKTTNDKINQVAEVDFLENYDSVITAVTIKLLQNGQVIDSIVRNVLIPAAPYSNEGLKVLIDSIYKNGEDINLTFEVSDEATEQLLYKIFPNNTSLFYNDVPVTDFTLERDKSGRVNEVDIVFILDVTGSMSNEIGSVKSNIIEFADSLTQNGIDYQLGMVTFLDIIENTYAFTSNKDEFKTLVGEQHAHGGGDYPENSLAAIYQGTSYQFRPQAKRIFIWITDAAYHINNSITSLTKEQVVDALLSKGIQTHCIGNPAEQLNFYDQITLNTGGNFYDINGNFRDILLDISRLGESPKFKISVNIGDSPSYSDLFKVEIHYAGKGGYDTIRYGNTNEAALFFKEKQIGINPMPINGNSTLIIFDKGEYNVKYQLMNLMGQVLYDGMQAGVTGQSPMVMSELIKYSEKSNQPLLLKVDLLDIDNNHIQTQVIKIIR